MTDHERYFHYLQRRSKLGGFYRKFWLYPKLARRLHGRALDIGCGIGDMLAFRPMTVGTDISDHTVRYCIERGLEAVRMQPDVLPFERASFDSALLDNVLEHIADPLPLLAEVRRVLVGKGHFVVGVPGTKGWNSDPDHKIRYDEARLVATITASGFVHQETFHTPLWRSPVLDTKLRQYCIYGVFRLK